MKAKHLIEVCEVCFEDIDGFEAHLIEAFEITGQILCESCCDELFEKLSSAAIGASHD